MKCGPAGPGFRQLAQTPAERLKFDSQPPVSFALNQFTIHRLESFTRLNFRVVLMLESKRNQTIGPRSIRKV